MKYRLPTRTVDNGQAQFSVHTDNKLKEGAQERITSRVAGTSSKKDFLFIQSYYACKIRSNHAGMKLVLAVWR